jgi:hypothetical protein
MKFDLVISLFPISACNRLQIMQSAALPTVGIQALGGGQMQVIYGRAARASCCKQPMSSARRGQTALPPRIPSRQQRHESSFARNRQLKFNKRCCVFGNSSPFHLKIFNA